jgi:curved DNA-binding protein CbpA
MSDDLYQTLGVRRNSSLKAIEKAYRRKAKETHPDRGGDAEAFGRVDRAYRILSHPEARANYDRTGRAEEPRPDETTHHALRILSGCLSVVLAALLEQNGKAENEDVVAHLRTALGNMRKELKGNRERMEKARKHLEEIVGRVEAAEGESVLVLAARGHLAQVEQQLAGVAQEEKWLEAAADILKRHRYRFEQQAQMFRPGSWRNGFTATSATAAW